MSRKAWSATIFSSRWFCRTTTYCRTITAVISSVDDTKIGPRPGVGKYAGMHTRAAIATGTYGSHIETSDGTCDTTTSVSRTRQLTSAAMPKVRNAAAQPMSMMWPLKYRPWAVR